MRKIILFLFPQIHKEIKDLRKRNTTLALQVNSQDRKYKGVIKEARMMSEYIVGLEKRLKNYEKSKSV